MCTERRAQAQCCSAGVRTSHVRSGPRWERKPDHQNTRACIHLSRWGFAHDRRVLACMTVCGSTSATRLLCRLNPFVDCWFYYRFTTGLPLFHRFITFTPLSEFDGQISLGTTTDSYCNFDAPPTRERHTVQRDGDENPFAHTAKHAAIATCFRSSPNTRVSPILSTTTTTVASLPREGVGPVPSRKTASAETTGLLAGWLIRLIC